MKGFILFLCLSAQVWAAGCESLLIRLIKDETWSIPRQTYKIEVGSLADKYPDIAKYIETLSGEYIHPVKFAQDFQDRYHKTPKLKDIFQAAIKQMQVINTELVQLRRDYPRSQHVLSPTIEGFDSFIKLNSKPKGHKASTLEQYFDYESEDQLLWLESSYFQFFRSQLSELAVALSTRKVLGQNIILNSFIKGHSRLIEFGQGFKQVLAEKMELMKIAFESDDYAEYLEKFPALFKANNRKQKNDALTLLNRAISRLEEKEFDIVSIDYDGKFIFTEVKTQRGVFGEDELSSNNLDGLFKQLDLTEDIFKFLELDDQIKIVMSFPYGVTFKIKRKLQRMGLEVKGHVVFF